MTARLDDMRERISLQDLAWAQLLLTKISESRLWTYAFNITSDTSHRGRKP